MWSVHLTSLIKYAFERQISYTLVYCTHVSSRVGQCLWKFLQWERNHGGSLFFHIADRYIDDEPLTHLVLYLIQSNHVNLDIDLIFVWSKNADKQNINFIFLVITHQINTFHLTWINFFLKYKKTSCQCIMCFFINCVKIVWYLEFSIIIWLIKCAHKKKIDWSKLILG